jgi:hypothetical protein
MAKRPICPLCGKDVPNEMIPNPEAKEGEEVKQIANPAVAYLWMHDPNNFHVDCRQPVHSACMTRVKAEPTMSNFDVCTQADYMGVGKVPQIPRIDSKTNTVKLIPLTDAFKKAEAVIDG